MLILFLLPFGICVNNFGMEHKNNSENLMDKITNIVHDIRKRIKETGNR